MTVLGGLPTAPEGQYVYPAKKPAFRSRMTESRGCPLTPRGPDHGAVIENSSASPPKTPASSHHRVWGEPIPSHSAAIQSMPRASAIVSATETSAKDHFGEFIPLITNGEQMGLRTRPEKSGIPVVPHSSPEPEKT